MWEDSVRVTLLTASEKQIIAMQKIFSTIARDLADRDPEMMRALADAVLATSSLKKTSDIIQQWQKLLIQLLRKSSGSTEEPIVIVLDGLDESGGVETYSVF
jgi:hypothetical protein